MAFTVKEEYVRLLKIKHAQEDKRNGMCFEHGCVGGYVTRIDYLPRRYSVEVHRYLDEEIQIYVNCFGNREELALVLKEHDVRKRYQDRKYRWNKQYEIFESFAR